MCGRLYVLADILRPQVQEELGLEFPLQTNLDLRPTDSVATLVSHEGKLQQLQTRWGIKPSWANKLLINAQAETVSKKRTFANAFEHNRCLVPCSGWFEWRDEGGPKKQKYLFSQRQQRPLYMAGIFYPTQTNTPELVTLTTSPNEICAAYHSRMPLFIKPEQIPIWFNSSPEELEPLLQCVDSGYVAVKGPC
ncbi:SOS response-associated peptidase [Shewanella sp. AS16]|uniref:SOS response-associated peptidase n=1 Tax=Shewanella sp. AS16 TaxID=2907625 RepID=UPI001F48CE69|nr:SOS response-associated peptidase [Shewanella sp. AS16]MCE9685818.1 SOS response-associated peptidase [Shewanella sp. AS16]